jgi:hypothetical protein
VDADFGVVDLDLVDDRAQAGAAERDGTVRHVFAHQGGKGVYLVFGDAGFRFEFGDGAVFSGPCLIAVAFQGCQPVLERVGSDASAMPFSIA